MYPWRWNNFYIWKRDRGRGDSLTNTMTPMSGPMVGALELADVDYTAWLKYAVPLIGILAVIAIIFITVLATMGWA